MLSGRRGAPPSTRAVSEVLPRVAGGKPFALAYNPTPPVEFGAPGIEIEVAWLDSRTTRSATAPRRRT
jgi:hypothetical protein